MTISVSPRQLHDWIRGNKRVVVLDVRWSMDRTAYDMYTMEHIPLAMYCDPEYDLAGIPSRSSGRNPLPDPEQVQRAVDRWGIDASTRVVIYDGGNGLFSSRAWWILRWAGLENVHVLDGGLPGWEAAGYEIIGGPGSLRARSEFTVDCGRMPVVDVEEVRTWPEHGVLVDAREESRYKGIRERLDLQSGHIPGAVNIPVNRLHVNGHVLPAEEIRATLAEYGITDGAQVAVYSGSGLHSSLFVQCMHEAGVPGASLFVGGWSKWAGDPSLPIGRVPRP